MGDRSRSDHFGIATAVPHIDHAASKPKSKPKDKDISNSKRRCVSSACIACRKRKSKCDGNLPKCAACASVYLTDCEYAPHTDHRRKGVYKKDVDGLKTKNTTLQVLIQAILNAEDDEDAFDLVKQIRACDNLEDLAQSIENGERGIMDTPDSPIYGDDYGEVPRFEAELSGKMGDLIIDGSVKFIGGTSNLIWLNDSNALPSNPSPAANGQVAVKPREEAILSWTTVTQDKDIILHFLNMYFCWHYAYFTTLSKELFYRDFLTGTDSQYCSRLLVNIMLALGCHFSSKPAARLNPDDSATTGDHYFAEAKRLLHENDEFGVPKLCTVQALALMSVREAGCGRESTGWVYSGLSFRMASDLGLNVDPDVMSDHRFSDEDRDARRITFWGCFLFDKCWSNYLGRQPQFLLANTSVKKPDVFGSEDSEQWSPYTDSGVAHVHTQPARTRAISLHICKLAEISSDLLSSFYQPQPMEKMVSKQAELKKLSDIHTRLEAWKKDLPPEMEAKDGQLPQVLLMHMFYQLLYVHLYRPFLKYTKATSPLPSHVSPRKFCTQAAGAISKLFRLYKRTHGLRQICNIAVYIAHSACTIHLLNLPDKNARRDIIHGLKQLEEIGDCWLCARRTLRMLGLCADRWNIELPEEAQAVLLRATQRWGDSQSPPAALSPRSMATLIQQPHLQQMPEHLVPNISQQDPMRNPSRSATSYAIPQPASTEATQNITSITGALPNQLGQPIFVPPSDQNGYHESNKSRFSLQLTQAQQDAWDAHQAKMTQLGPRGTRTPNDQPLNAASLFGGVDSLIEESQNWWYHDQSQIALGFDNWNTNSSDWSNMAGSGHMSMPHMDGNGGIQLPLNHVTAPYTNTNQMQNAGGQMIPPHPSATNNAYPMTMPQQHMQHTPPSHRHTNSQSLSPPLQNNHQSSPPSINHKRHSSYDDDLQY